MLLYLINFKIDLSDEFGPECWQLVQDTQKRHGKVLTVLPWNTKRPSRIGYHFETADYHRTAKEAPGELFYDFVVYSHPRIKTGYSLRLQDNDGVRICDPLPAPPVAEPTGAPDRELSASAQAAAWLMSNPGHTHAEAAILFGVSRVAVTQAVARYKARGA